MNNTFNNISINSDNIEMSTQKKNLTEPLLNDIENPVINASQEDEKIKEIDELSDIIILMNKKHNEIKKEEKIINLINQSLNILPNTKDSDTKKEEARKIFNEKLKTSLESLSIKNKELSELLNKKNAVNKYGIIHTSEIENIVKEYNEKERLLNNNSNNEGLQSTKFNTYSKVKKTTYMEVYKILEELFHKQSNNSLILDIIIIYIKCQKMLYIEAKTYCEGKLYKLMLPAIFISALTTILSLLLKDYYWGSIIVSCISGVNSFILALISYLKLDGKAEAHKISAHKFDKLQSFCEFKSGQLLLSDKPSQNDDTKKDEIQQKPKQTLDEIIEEIGEKVKEIKETNNFILPEIIRFKFKDIYSSNIFGDVKELQNKEYVKINELKNMINKIKIGYAQLEQLYDENNSNNFDEEEKLRKTITELEIEKQAKMTEIILYKNNYINLYSIYKKEINKYINESMSQRIVCCTMLRT